MRSPDPVCAARRRLRTVRLLGAAAVTACAAWALWPVEATPVLTPQGSEPLDSERVVSGAVPFNVDAFAAALWVEPPAEKPVAEAPPPPPPVRLELIGIVTKPDPETGEPVRYAALHDPAENRLHVVKSGERLAGQTVERVEEAAVVLSIDGRTARLALAREGTP